jgi:pimeloyl-ACP methyl ester carboxylesterase
MTATPAVPATFVLVHGAWHGGWCWRRVADRLIAKGHRVFAPTLTGLGERSHLMSDTINLATHIADIVNLIRWERLADIALVGHSYGGIIITGVVERVESSISSMVFLDALVPEAGQSQAELTTPLVRDLIATATQNSDIAVSPVPASVFRVNENDGAWVDAMCTPHPLATMLDKSLAVGARDRFANKTYIRAKAYPNALYDAYRARFAQTPGWRVHELPCGHDAMIDMPEELTDLLLASA